LRAFAGFSRVTRRRKARIAVFVQENFGRPSRGMDRRIESGDDILRVDRNRNAAWSGLTMRKHCGASCADPEQARRRLLH
jgi:hypothetical protein